MPRSRNPRGEGGRLRDDIVRAATDLLDETGSAGAVSLRAVARRAGIAAPSIYAHFADPPSILLAAAEQEFAALLQEVRSAVAAVDDPPVARLRAFCTAYLGYAASRPRRYLVMFGGVWNAERSIAAGEVDVADVADLGQDLMADLVQLLRACVEAGDSSSDDPPTDAIALWLGLHGLAHQRIVTAAYPWPPGVEDRLVRHLARL